MLTWAAVLTAIIVTLLVVRLTGAMALRAFRTFVRSLWPH